MDGSTPETNRSKLHPKPEELVSQAVVIVHCPPVAYCTKTPTPAPALTLMVAPVSIAAFSGVVVIV